MTRSQISKLAALCAVGLLATLAAASKPARSASQSSCQLKIQRFAEVAYFTDKEGVTSYQYAITLQASAPAGWDVNASGELVGGGGHNSISGIRNMTPGTTRVIFWTTADWSAAHSHKESLTLELHCDGYSDGEQYANASATTRLYKPGEAQPLVQPWVNGCPDWLVIDSRGSGETKGTISPPGAVFVNALRVDYLQRNVLGRDFVIESLANPYPAKGGWVAMFGAKEGLPLTYHRSVVAGKKWLMKELGQIHSRCHRSKVYLTGYSQGAQVSGDVYQKLRWKIGGMTLFGDPSFNGTDTSDRVNYSPVYNGALHRRQAFNSKRVWSFCHKYDPVCQGLPTNFIRHKLKYHTNYDKHGEPQLAARYFVFGS